MLDTITTNKDPHSSETADLKNEEEHVKYGNHKQIINADDDEDPMDVFGFRKCTVKTSLVILAYFLTLGLLRLFFHWYPHLKLLATHTRCDLEVAEKVLIVDKYKQKYVTYFVENVKILSCRLQGRCENEKAKDMVSSENEENLTNGDVDAYDKIVFCLSNGCKKEASKIRAFWCKKVCFVWDKDTKTFLQLVGLDNSIAKIELHGFRGFDAREEAVRRVIYGSNEIDAPLESILRLFVLEALTPFYIFQVFSLVVWFAEEYYYYTIAIVIMSVYGIASSIIQTRRNQKNLKGTVHSTDKVTVCRGVGTFEDVPTTHLVPGDVIVIPSHGCIVHCDAVLLNGNCIVNESMLTGESVPVLKTALPKTSAKYRTKEDAIHTLFCGTTVIQSRYYGNENVMAVVLRTGFLTSKGQLVRSIMYPPPADFKFDQDSYKFIGILAAIATLGFIYTVVSKSTKNIAAGDTIIKALDIITIVIPPALPAAMTVGKLYALNRLKRKNIYCINSRIINVSGSVNCICFDKTGTLTEDGLDMWGTIPVDNLKLQNPVRDSAALPVDSHLLRGMVTCHSLTLIDGELTGDPLDVKMFESTGWILEEPEVADSAKYDLLAPTVVRPPNAPDRRTSLTFDDPAEIKTSSPEIGIIHQFQFSSTLQRMSVVTRSLGSNDYVLYCKGSPEMILSLSKPDSVPHDVLHNLKEYTEQGYRVIAVGWKVLDDVNLVKIQKMHREEVECELNFVGLVILENRLKSQTTAVIGILKSAGMKIVMITGDNIQTAISVAKECGIVEQGTRILDVHVRNANKPTEAKLEFNDADLHPLGANGYRFEGGNWTDVEKSKTCRWQVAVTGQTWTALKQHFPDEIPKIIERGTVFARMSSDQKQQLVVELQNIGYYVAMCGDGTNDCGALKAAHVGISLSEAEASVASPFTSKDANISCVPEVIKEGRAALVTSFGVFKFMLCYSLTEFISVIILYGIDSNLTSMQFLFIDIFLALNFASIFGLTEAYDGALVKKAPTTSLLGFTPIMSLVFHIFTVVIFQVTSFVIIHTYDWFKPFVYHPEKGNYYTSYENYAVFTASMFQYITMAIIFSKGKPYRRPIYSNKYLTVSILVMIAVCAYITLTPAGWIASVLEMMLPPSYDARVLICMLAAVNFLVAVVTEEVVVEFLLDKKVKPMFQNLDKSRKKYLRIERDLKSSNWPFVQNADDEGGGGGKRSFAERTPNGICNEAFEIVDESSYAKP